MARVVLVPVAAPVTVTGTVTVVPPEVIAGFVLLYVLVGIYIASALISKKHRTPYDWAAGSYVIKADAG